MPNYALHCVTLLFVAYSVCKHFSYPHPYLVHYCSVVYITILRAMLTLQCKDMFLILVTAVATCVYCLFIFC